MGLMDLLTGAYDSTRQFLTKDLTDEQRQALLAASFSLMQPAQNTAAAIGRAGMFGLERYDQAQQNTRRNDLMKTEAEQRRIQTEQLKLALEDAKRRRAMSAQIFGGASAPAPGGNDPYEDAYSQPGALPPGYTRDAGARPPVMGESPGWRGSAMEAAVAPAPQSPPASRGAQSAGFNKLVERAIQSFTASGDTAEAEKYVKMLQALEGKAHGEVQQDKDGKPYYMTDRGPRYTEGGAFVPRSKISWHDQGNKLVPRGQFGETPTGIADIIKQMNPDQAWQRDKELRYGSIHEGFDENGNRATFRIPLVGPAQRVQGTGSERKTLTQGEGEKLLTLDQLAAQASVAQEAVRTNPRAIGPENKLTPQWMLDSFGTVANIDTRAKLSDISTQILLARSGAAVTEHEFKRLAPFLATQNDTAESAKAKLKNLENELRSQAKARRSFYSSQGYRVPPSTMDAAFGSGGETSSTGNFSGLPGNMTPFQLMSALEKSLKERK